MHVPACHIPGAKLDPAHWVHDTILDQQLRQLHLRRQGNAAGAEVRSMSREDVLTIDAALPSKELALLDSHYLEPPARAFAAHCILPSSCIFHATVAFRTTHMKLTILLASVSTLKSGSPPKFHSPDIPLDAEALQGAAPR
ncbi:hypothetical protein B0H19DRAFT_1067894 [Mycena capillaripes]|nr:hypothetical protein B0H19DRAFT_1067894 [Mycena capillaripes]